MRSYLILISTLVMAGCATHRSAVSSPPAAQPVVRETAPMREMETRYDVRSYRDADDPSVRHDAHAVFRETLVPARVTSLETITRNNFAPITYDPLPPSAELMAEIAEQKQITAQLRSIQVAMAAMETRARNQYGNLVDQTEESLKLRRELEEDRARVRELEAKLQSAQPNTAQNLTVETKW